MSVSTRPSKIFSQIFSQAIADHLAVIRSLPSQQPVLEQIAAEMTRAIVEGRKVLWCGNGGSAADSQHLAAEFVGRFQRERRGLPSIALTTDTSILTQSQTIMATTIFSGGRWKRIASKATSSWASRPPGTAKMCARR